MIMNNESTFLGGKLVGIGKIRTTGEVEHIFLDKPISNRIVTGGLDLLFSPNLTTNYQWQSANSADSGPTPSWRALGNNTGMYGPLSFLAIGTDATPTQFTDTGLRNIVGLDANTYTYTTYIPAGASGIGVLNGTEINSFGNYSFRITHQSAPMTSNTTIRELGWFGAYGANTNNTLGAGTPVLFARVVLDTPIVLATGEYLLTTYQLDEVDSCLTETPVSNFFNLTDANGQPLQAVKKFCRYGSRSSSGESRFHCTIGGPYIIKTTAAGSNGNYSDGIRLPYYDYHYYSGPVAVNSSSFYYSTNSSKNFPADFADDRTNLLDVTTGRPNQGQFTYEILPYNCIGQNTKYRDWKLTLGAYCPQLTADIDSYIDIYYLRIRGMNYRLGYYNGSTWVPQALRKYANQAMTFTFRTSYSTVDTTNN